MPHPPSPRSDEVRPHAFVPGELPLGGSDVVEGCLHLDHEERSGSTIECHEINPAVRSALGDLDLPEALESVRLKPALNMGRASGVDDVTLAGADHRRLLSCDLEIEPERPGDALDDVDRRVRMAELDCRDVCACQAASPRELVLGDVQPDARRPEQVADAYAERCSHRDSEPGCAYRPITFGSTGHGRTVARGGRVTPATPSPVAAGGPGDPGDPGGRLVCKYQTRDSDG